MAWAHIVGYLIFQLPFRDSILDIARGYRAIPFNSLFGIHARSTVRYTGMSGPFNSLFGIHHMAKHFGDNFFRFQLPFRDSLRDPDEREGREQQLSTPFSGFL